MNEKEIFDIIKPIAGSIDSATGKIFTKFAKVFIGPWESYMYYRIYKFFEYAKNNEINEDEFVNFIENMNVDEREIFITLIQKTLHSPSDIELYLLAKINAYLLKNGKLDYFHASLLSATNILNEQDYKNMYNLILAYNESRNLVETANREKSITYKENIEESVCFLTQEEELNNTVNSLIQKLFSVGFLIQANVIDEGTTQLENGKYKSISFLRTQNFIRLIDYIRSYYEEND